MFFWRLLHAILLICVNIGVNVELNFKLPSRVEQLANQLKTRLITPTFSWFHSLRQHELWSDAVQQRQQLENGVSASRLSCCFALVHIWCMWCATAVQTEVSGFYLMSATVLYLRSPVSVFLLSLSHSKFKNVCKHTCRHTKKQVPLLRSQEQKGLLFRMLRAVSSVTCDKSHLLKNFYFIKENILSSGEDPVNEGCFDSWGSFEL